jgi:hypothetical protein
MDEEVDTGFDAVLAGEKWEETPSVVPNVGNTEPVADVLEQAAPAVASSLPEGESEPSVMPAYPGGGAVTATVTEAPGLTEAGKQAAKSLVQLPPLDYTQLAKLAREIAMDIKERHIVLQEFNLNDTQYDFLVEHNDFYKQALQAASLEWHAPLSTQERIKLEAAAILEDAMPGLGARLQNTREQLPGVVEAAKLFAKIAGVGERETGAGAPGERFVINIDLGGGKTASISTGPAPQEAAQLPVRSAFADETGAESDGPALQPVP